jgi:hypothetical protein
VVTVADSLEDPARRAELLKDIAPEAAAAHHELLRDIFRVEMEHRRAGGDDEYFENLYWCAFLLNQVGDPSDVPMMWEAKHIDFDTASGFDVQFLLGAGVEPTLEYLRRQGLADLARELSEFPELHEDLGQWAAIRRGYFYGH